MATLVPRAVWRDKRRMRAAFLSACRMLRPIGAAIVAFALPPRCPGCGVVTGRDHSFCLECWRSIDFLGGPSCATCFQPLPDALDPVARCGACLADPPPFDRLRAAVAYGPIARSLALKLKYGRRTGIAVTMAGLMRHRAGDLTDDVLLVPVPLHRWRLWGRGYNQAALIARALARNGGGRVAVDLLERRLSTPPLQGLGRSSRRSAVEGAFALAPRWAGRLKGAHVVLVDDVYTTGATAAGCARVLRRGGAGEITVLCWARVLPPGTGSVDIAGV